MMKTTFQKTEKLWLCIATVTFFLINAQTVAAQWATNGNNINNTNSGNVGIGTTSPGAKLEVNRGGSSGEAIRVSSGASGNYVYYGIGRTALESLVGIAAGSDQFFTGTAAGDFIINAQSSSQKLFFGAGTSPTVVMTSANVGIGIATPTAKLHVIGDGKFTGNLTVDGNIAAKYQDVAEWVPSSEQLAAGTVVVLDPTKSNQVISSTVSYDTRVAGVISEQPGIALGEKSDSKVLVATTGRVKVKVDATRAPIRIGDLLVTSDIPGVAMKSEPVNIGGVQLHRPGTLIGKALEPLAKGKGEILVLLSLQ
jgi:hypothetical protein